MTRREKVKARLARIRRRLRGLVGAERNRDAVTAKRKQVYLHLRELHSDDDPTVQLALRRYRESRALSVRIDETQAVLRRRADDKVKWLREHPAPFDPDGDGLVVVDGKQVSTAIAGEVLRIRRAGRWKGVVVSGFRTPEHSVSLCRDMCGADSCQGRCAGAASRHAKKGGRDGAIDVSDFITFGQECERLGSWLENHLPKDLVHFSDVGN